MNFKTLMNKNIKDIDEIMEYVNSFTNESLNYFNTKFGIEELDNVTYKFGITKTLIILSKGKPSIYIPLNDKEVKVFSDEDMLIQLYTSEEVKGFKEYDLLIYRIDKHKLSEIMKGIEEVTKSNK